MSQADLEISVFHRSADDYGVTLRFRHPAAGQDKSASGLLALDEAALRQHQHDAAAYGEALAAQVFAGEGVRSFLDHALAVAASQQTPLHLRLFIAPDAAALHAVRWETLRLSGSTAPLAAGEWVRFSRYLDSAGWRPARTVERNALAALVAVASPDVSGTTLAEVRTEDELAAARAGLGDIPFTAQAGRGQVTLATLLARLRAGCDILYLVAHGMVVDGEPQILLEKEDGGRAWTSGRELAARLGELANPPSLAVLVSCQSAGTGNAAIEGMDGGALAGLGPRLAAAGVPAVVAMQGNLTMDTAAVFMPTFLRELRRDGVVDRAMSVARGAVRARADWWMPVLYTRLADGRVLDLPNAADDPLFDLPPLPQLDLPEKPFHYLNWYRREDAEIFFGRGKEIRSLFDRVIAPDGEPIILLYGQSGVGKSSVLAAGLRPRLEASHDVRYMRRDQARGLLGTLAAGLPVEPDEDLASAWRRLEAQCGKPLLVVLDQVEEFFTRPNPEQPGELTNFLGALKQLFGDASRRPCGRLLLGFRKEWLAEIDKRLAESALPRAGVFLERLDRDGIAEVVAGPTSRPRLRGRYGLDVTDALPSMIADDLLADRESPVAPMLAILLADMWDAAKDRSYDRPVFNEDLYHEFRSRGLSLDDFLGRQLAALRNELPEVVDSGLALDLLAYHTTPLGTAEQRPMADLQQTYSHRLDVLPGLVQQCQDLYLLVDPAKNQPGQPSASRLTHDTLAPHVRKRFDESDAPGQRARRLLENRASDWQNDYTSSVLDYTDLAVAERGVAGMRKWSVLEIMLIDKSRQERIHQLKRSRVVRFAFAAAVILIIASLATALFLANDELRRAAALRFYQRAVELRETGNAIEAIAVLKKAQDADPSLQIDLKDEEAKIRREVASRLIRMGEASAREGDTRNMRRRFEEAQSLSPPHDTPIYVWVPSGQFIIGSDIDDPYASSADRPKSPAHLDGYWISRNEVTNAQYVECMKARVCEAPNDSRYLETQYAANPVTGLTLHQARTYAQWVGGRLPTEMEWEKACRGPFGRIFPWGDADPDPRRLNYAETRIFSWLAVGSFAGDVSPYGVLDMAGNVAEWTDSSFLDNTQSELFVIKGGSYGIYDVTALRCTNLRSARASAPDFHLGFRVVFTEYPGLK